MSEVPQLLNYNANIFLNDVFLGKSHYGLPHQISNPLSRKTLWELMLILNNQSITGASFKSIISEFLNDEPQIIDTDRERQRPFLNWDIIYRFVSLQTLDSDVDSEGPEIWQGKILIQVPDTQLARTVGGDLSPSMQLASAYIPIEHYWQWYRSEDNTQHLVNNNGNPE